MRRVRASSAPERLVGKQQLGLAHKRSGQRHTLLFATGEFGGPGLFAARESDVGERGAAGLCGVTTGQTQGDVTAPATTGAGEPKTHRRIAGDEQIVGAIDADVESGDRT